NASRPRHLITLVPAVLRNSRRCPCSTLMRHRPPPSYYPLPLHDALPISPRQLAGGGLAQQARARVLEARPRARGRASSTRARARSEEHTSELQSPDHIVCRLLLEKKKTKTKHEDNEHSHRV